jgi:uncharacterized membrane protein YcaP (DUF421 family)
MWQLTLPWWEFVLRALIVYVFLMVLLRITGRRQVGQLSPFDLVLLLVLSNGLQNAMNGGDNSITGGIILSVTLVGVNWIVGWVAWRSKAFSKVIEGRPEVLVHNGKIYRDVMERERLSQADLDMALRRAGCSSVEEVHFAVLETNGQVSVHKRDRQRDGERDGKAGAG